MKTPRTQFNCRGKEVWEKLQIKCHIHGVTPMVDLGIDGVHKAMGCFKCFGQYPIMNLFYKKPPVEEGLVATSR